MSDETADRNDRIKAAMKQRETSLNKDGGAGQKVCSPRQIPESEVTKTTGSHRDPYRK
jgi:hypothetical protein